MCTTANYIKEVCTKITSRSANKNFISIQSILLTKKKKKWKPWHSLDIFYFLCTTSHSCCNQMTCEKPSCKTPAERKQVRQRGDGLSRIRIQQAINRSIFLKVQMKCMQFTLKTNIYNSFFFFFFKSNLLHNKYVGETWRTGENKNRFCFIRTKALLELPYHNVHSLL